MVDAEISFVGGGGGYIFSTSNCIYTGMPLRRHQLMLDVWRAEGNYPQ